MSRTALGLRPLWPTLLPELRQFPEAQREAALRLAGETSLDVLELVGMALGLVVVTAATKYTLPDESVTTRVLMALLNLAVAAPLLVVVLGPFHLRRLRRGLRAQLDRSGTR